MKTAFEWKNQLNAYSSINVTEDTVKQLTDGDKNMTLKQFTDGFGKYKRSRKKYKLGYTNEELQQWQEEYLNIVLQIERNKMLEYLKIVLQIERNKMLKSLNKAMFGN